MKQIFLIIKERWQSEMPKFFKWVMGISISIASIALAIQLALTEGGATAPAWWENVYPYLIGVGAGMTAASKLTQKH